MCVIFACGVFVVCIYMSLHDVIQMEQIGSRMVNKVDSFYAINKRLPELQDIMYLEDEHGIGPFYEKISTDKYSIYFGLGFDEYYMYDSDKKEWEYYPRPSGTQKVVSKLRKTISK